MPLQITQPREKVRFRDQIGNVVNAYAQLSGQRAEDKALQSQLGVDLSKIQDPQTRQTLIADALKYGRMNQQAKASQNVNLQAPQNQRAAGRGQEFIEQQTSGRQKFEAPRFMGMEDRPSQGPGRPSPSNMPQQATTGEKVPVLDPQGVIAEAQRIQQESLESGLPMSQFDAYDLADRQNQANIAHNAGVEAEQDKRRLAQETYGQYGESAISNVYPEATDEIKAIFQKKGEDAAGMFKSEAEVKRHLAQEAKNFANTVTQVRNSIGPPRATSTQKLLGTDRESDAVKTSFRNKLKPLLDLGLYDTARNELSKLGYHPEERETILSDLGEGAKKTLIEMPMMNREKGYGEVSFKKGYPEREGARLNPLNSAQKSILRNNLSKVFQSDPSTNLVLLRKQYEDKGVDWREFSEALHEKMYNGEIKLNPDQFQMLVHIDEPPLNDLEKILHGAKLIGR